MKYIDTERLKAEIERLKSVLADPLCSYGNILGPDWVAGGNKMLKEISSAITSLQQEQPEVDLEKEIDACWQNWLSPSNQKEVEGVLPKTEFAMYASHFYELGRQAKPEVFDTVAFQKGVQEGRRLEREDAKSTIQSRIDEILGDAQPAPILRIELQELIKKIEA